MLALSCAVPDGFPRIVQHPSTKHVRQGQTSRPTIMTCSASGNPQPTVTWYKNVVPLNMSDTRLQVLSNGMYIFIPSAIAINVKTRSQAVARIADRTASQKT